MKFLKGLIVFISIIIFMLIAYTITNNFFEPKAFNFMVKNFTAQKSGNKDIVIIVIDDKSIGKYRWPWKRELYCNIFNYFKEYSNTKVVVNDAVFATPDSENPISDTRYFQSLSKLNNLIVGFDLVQDRELSKKQQAIYDTKFHRKFDIDIKDSRTYSSPDMFEALLPFPRTYFNSVKMTGAVKTPVSRCDSFLRSVPYVLQYNNNLYPSLALRAFSYLNNNEGYTVNDHNIVGDKSGIEIPRNNDKGGIYTFIKFYKRYGDSTSYTHKTYSAVDIMESYDLLKAGKTPIINPREFDNKIVFVGANVRAVATGLSDILRTPISNEQSGVDVQATVLDNLISNDFMSQAKDSQNLIVTFLLMIMAYLMIRRFSLFVSVTSILAITIAYLIYCGISFSDNYAVSVITPLSLEFITMIFAYSHKSIIEGKNKEKIKSAMGKYISEDIMESVVKNIDELKLGGKKANVTVLFSDIRGFTSMSEKLSADEVSVILNEYFTEMEPIVTKHHGVINKFIGDAVMVIFGEPIYDENHPINAIRCANEMLEKVNELQHKWLEEGKPRIEIGIGINTGEAFVGNIGSEKRMEYTVIGDMVNLASRIESYNKIYKTNFLISSSTFACVKNIVDVIKISNVTIRGKAKKMDLYEVISLIG